MDNDLKSAVAVAVAVATKSTEGPVGERSDYLPTSTNLVCLNFKVPLRIRQRFKIYAARHNMTMTELMLQLFDDCFEADTIKSNPPVSQNKK